MASRGGHPGRTLIVFGLLIAILYGLMAFTHNWTPKLGLDLQGGTTITLTAQNSDGSGKIDPASLQLARTIIQARVDSLGVGETEVTTSGDRQIVVSVPNVQQDELVRMVGQTAELRFRAVYAIDSVAPPATPTPEPSAGSADGASQTPAPSASQATPADRRPAPQLPTAPPQPSSPRPTAPGKGTPPDQAINWEPSTADQADFASFTCDQAEAQPDVSDQPLLACNKEKTEKYLLGPTLIEGTKLSSAAAGVPQNQVQWVVNLEFNSEGGQAFEQATRTLASRQPPQNQFAIVLDSEVISAPSVSTAIAGGRAEISGNFNQQSATELANVLKYGALPLSFEVSEVSNVSATLGSEQLRAGIIAGAIGLLLVVLYCFAYYRGLGIVVVSSLGIGAAITYACVVLLGSSVGFALNLPGIAGAIVAIGVTADSFVIYFERIRDEVRDGRSLKTSIETGWVRARQTILIADAVSMLSAVVLFVLAIGSVKGFAFTLGLTTIIDVAVVFFFTKPLMTLLGRTKFFGQGHKWSGLDPTHLGVSTLPGSRVGRPVGSRTGSSRPGREAVTNRHGGGVDVSA